MFFPRISPAWFSEDVWHHFWFHLGRCCDALGALWGTLASFSRFLHVHANRVKFRRGSRHVQAGMSAYRTPVSRTCRNLSGRTLSKEIPFLGRLARAKADNPYPQNCSFEPQAPRPAPSSLYKGGFRGSPPYLENNET